MEYFTYIPSLKVITCKTCRIGLFSDQIVEHLRRFPHKVTLTKEEKQSLLSWLGSLDHIRNTGDIEKLPRPIPLRQPYSELQSPRPNYFKCTVTQSCHQVYAKLKHMNDHLRKAHQVLLQDCKKGRPAKGKSIALPSPNFRTGVYCQRVLYSGPRSELFEVNPEARPAEPSDQEVAIKDFFKNRSLIVRTDANMMEQPDQFTQPSPWLDRLGCVMHLQGFADKKDFLRGLISTDLDLSAKLFDESDDFIYLMVFIVLDQLVWEAQGLIYRQEVPLNARFEVARYDINTASRKPFNFRHKQETKRRYATILKQLIIYALRCLALDDPAERPPFK
ncbi:hypothetical protein ACKRZS_008678, partial [Fusarium odoratissimum]